MKKFFIGILLFGVGLVLLSFFMKQTPSSDNATPVAEENSLDTPTAEIPPSKIAIAYQKASPQEKPKIEKASLKAMTIMLSTYSQTGRSLEDLVNDLNSEGHKPFVSNNKNPYTGKMSIVRTQSPLPGTRYFHAQYFGDDKTPDELQHMSFEFRAGPKAFDEAVDAIFGAFPGIGLPNVNDADFKEWKLRDGRSLWVKKMDKEDISTDDPFNAYTSADIGTIRVVIENDPHGDENGDDADLVDDGHGH